MEILEVLGIVVFIVFLFVGGGILGWLLKGIGVVFEFLFEGWGSCLRVIVWIILIIILLMALAS
jgi:hypothetical protein